MTRRIALGLATLLAFAVTAASADAQTNPRFGLWQIQSDAPPPSSNFMTYEPYGDGGMRITVEATNAEGEKNTWGYVTLFDGEFRPVSGQTNAMTAVEIVDEKTNKISNMRDGRVYQIIINVLSDDGNSIDNEYQRLDEDGNIESVSHAVYIRVR